MTSPFGTIFGNNTVPGAETRLCPGNSGTVLQTTFADDDGDYVFANVQPGAYTVRQVVPAGYQQISPETPAGQPTYGYHTNSVAGKKTKGVNFVNTKIPPAPAPIPAPGPSPQPSPVLTTFSRGGNIGASPVSKTLAAFAKFKLKRARFFSPDNFAHAVSAGVLSTLRSFQGQSLQTNIVFGFQGTRNKAPTSTIAGHVNSFPDDLVKGQWGGWGNEFDLFQSSETPANIVTGLAIFSKAWRAKGGLVVLGNISKPGDAGCWDFYQQIFAAGAAQYIDAWGAHPYPSSAAQALPAYDKVIVECQKRDIICYCDEGSFHGLDAAGVAREAPILLAGLQMRNLMFDWFPVGWTNTGAGICSLLNQDGTNHEPVYSAVLGAISK